MLIIDCHAHIYSPDEWSYPPTADPLRVPGGSGSIEKLRSIMQENQVSAVRAVQTVSFYGYDNRYLADVCKTHPDWVSGVCTLDPDDPHSTGYLRQLVQEHGVKSLRSIPAQSRSSFNQKAVHQLWAQALELGITVDIFLMELEWVQEAEKLLYQFPDLCVALCHCLDIKPGNEYKDRLDAVLRLARFPNLYAKLDFIATGTQRGYPGDDLHEAALQIIGTYGAERSIWGSNYPNELWTPGITYNEHLRIFLEELPLNRNERIQVLGETARRLWFPHLQTLDES